ncbi:hypothetical protein LY90DRAFT_698490 [Neocallimastix californiae]|uniref:Uncharacterized protein n=1 Tax=Neocallimastix californiae TaxID=1754190 RepID=A0A1Y2F4W6_9FUNG|nr:hypothetical protein LY90DRAFT_698490 [Neocallimastix californiae]|eukprot:ORY77975.1 hypothetical protein LY90DRAFT_698490 [Neocallimastix californiae]
MKSTVVNGHGTVNNGKIKPIKLFSTRSNSTTSTHDLSNPKNDSTSSPSLLSYSALYDTNGLGFDKLNNLNTIADTNTIDIADAEIKDLNNDINIYTNTDTNSNININTTNNNNDNNNFSRRTLTKHEEVELYSNQPNYEGGPPSY